MRGVELSQVLGPPIGRNDPLRDSTSPVKSRQYHFERVGSDLFYLYFIKI